MPSTDERSPFDFGSALAIGVSLGMIFGLLLDNIAMGLVTGLMLATLAARGEFTTRRERWYSSDYSSCSSGWPPWSLWVGRWSSV